MINNFQLIRVDIKFEMHSKDESLNETHYKLQYKEFMKLCKSLELTESSIFIHKRLMLHLNLFQNFCLIFIKLPISKYLI